MQALDAAGEHSVLNSVGLEHVDGKLPVGVSVSHLCRASH